MDDFIMQSYILNESQEKEIMHIAETILASRKLDQQRWEDAWKGQYPEQADQPELQAEFETLRRKAVRLLLGECDLEAEHADTEEVIRMIHLESCSTFNIWQGGQ